MLRVLPFLLVLATSVCASEIQAQAIQGQQLPCIGDSKQAPGVVQRCILSALALKANNKALLANAVSSLFIGATNSKVTVYLFIDWQCPYCKREVEALLKLAKNPKLPLLIKLLDLPRPQHAWATEASLRIQCIADQSQETAWNAAKLILEDQALINSNVLDRYTSGVVQQNTALNYEAYRSCIASSRPREAVSRSLALGASLGVSRTPTIFIDGVFIEGEQSEDRLSQLIRSAWEDSLVFPIYR